MRSASTSSIAGDCVPLSPTGGPAAPDKRCASPCDNQHSSLHLLVHPQVLTMSWLQLPVVSHHLAPQDSKTDSSELVVVGPV